MNNIPTIPHDNEIGIGTGKDQDHSPCDQYFSNKTPSGLSAIGGLSLSLHYLYLPKPKYLDSVIVKT